MKLRLAAVVMSFMFLTSCSGGDDPSTTTSSPTSRTSPTSPTTSRQSAAVAGAAGTEGTVRGRETPNAAADALIQSWKAGDREAAASVADPPAVDALFRVPFESDAAAPIFQECGPNPGFENAEVCSFTYPGGSMHMVMRSLNGWRVERLEYVAE